MQRDEYLEGTTPEPHEDLEAEEQRAVEGEELGIPDSAQPDSQGDEPLDAQLGPDGQGDLAPEDL
jgi:hypothetical protein